MEAFSFVFWSLPLPSSSNLVSWYRKTHLLWVPAPRIADPCCWAVSAAFEGRQSFWSGGGFLFFWVFFLFSFSNLSSLCLKMSHPYLPEARSSVVFPFLSRGSLSAPLPDEERFSTQSQCNFALKRDQSTWAVLPGLNKQHFLLVIPSHLGRSSGRCPCLCWN